MSSRSIQQDELSTPLTPYFEAVGRVVSATSALPSVAVAVSEADGLVLARDIAVTADLPRWDNASMDGYAVLSSETMDAPVALALSRIMTGHPLPPNTDAVVPWEHTTTVGDLVRLEKPVNKGAFVRLAGEDAHEGDVVMHEGDVLTPVHLGMLAALGHADVVVNARPRVTVVCTGDEIVAPGSQLQDHQIYDANGAMLPALLRRTGADVVSVRYTADDKEMIRTELLAAAEEADAIVTTGGASVGVHDWMRAVVEEEGEVALWRVALRPGKPFAYGQVRDTPIFVLPGNPASVAACLHAFTVPSLRKMAGRASVHRTANATLVEEFFVTGDRTFLCPVRCENGRAWPMRAGSSSVLSNQLQANGFVVAEPGLLKQGAEVIVELTD